MRKRLFVVILLVVVWVGAVHHAQAEDGVEITPQPPTYEFGNYITFNATLDADILPQDIKLIIEAPGLSSFVGTANFTSPDQITYVYNLTSRPLRAFSEVIYRYRVELENGEIYTSEDFSFKYIDNRYAWQTLEAEDFLVSWYEGDVAFAQEILDTARQGQADFEALLSIPQGETRPVAIYAYASASELQSTLMMTGQTWVAGHADATVGAIVVSLPLGEVRSLEIMRQVPHELAHILLYRTMGDTYQNLPRWLNEGIASQMEASSNPDYLLYLEKAYEDHGLINIEDLCQRFPSDAAASFLAYAQADSLTRYLMDQYGTESIRKLVSAYQTGVDCDRGVEIALEKDLGQLQQEWQNAVLGKKTSPSPIMEAGLGFLPWLVIFGVVFAPLTGYVIFHNRKDEN